MCYYKIYNPQIDEINSNSIIKNLTTSGDLSSNHTDIEKYFYEVSGSIAKYFENKNTVQINKSWLTTYSTNSTNELHTHEDKVFTESNSSHVLIQVLETDIVPENLVVYDGSTKNSIPIVTGDIVVFHRSVVHGLDTTINKLKVLVLGINFKEI